MIIIGRTAASYVSEPLRHPRIKSHLSAKIVPAKIRRLEISGTLPLDVRISPLTLEIPPHRLLLRSTVKGH